MVFYIYSDINHSKGSHSCESRNPEKHWIPGRARNDKPYKTFVVMYKMIAPSFLIFSIPGKKKYFLSLTHLKGYPVIGHGTRKPFAIVETSFYGEKDNG